MCVSCSNSRANRVPLTVNELPGPDNTLLFDRGDLKVAPLDVLEIKVFRADDLSGTYHVDPTGRIKFPLIGPIEVQGYTSFELASTLEAKLAEKFLQNPVVTVRISEVNGRQFTIEGAIGKPGMYPVRGPMTLLQAIAVSGGPSGSANLDGIIIFRTIEGQRRAARFDLRKIRSGESADPVVYGNDLIVVDDRGTNETYEEVLRGLPVIGVFAALM